MCLTLSHLVTLLEPNDLERLPDTLTFSQEVIRERVFKANATLPPERVCCMMKACQNLKELHNFDALTLSQERNLDILEGIFQDLS